MASVELGEGPPLGVPAVLQHVAVDGIAHGAPPLDRTGHSKLLDRLHCPVQGHPAHDLGVGEVAPWPAHLPDALVRLGPRGLEPLHEVRQHAPGVAGAAAEPELHPGEGSVHQLAIDVELELLGGGVADPDRSRTLVAGKPGQLELGEPPLAADAVDGAEVVRAPGHAPQQPVAPGQGLVAIAALEQRVEGERRVAYPAETVVPVPHAPEALGERRRRSSDDASGGLEGQCLQRQERADHRLPPRPLVGAAVGPLLPVALGRLQLVGSDRGDGAPSGGWGAR